MQPIYNQPQGFQAPLRQGPPSNPYPNLSPYPANTQQPYGYPQLDQQPTIYSNQPVRYLPPNQYNNNNLSAEETPLIAKERDLKQQIAEIEKTLDGGCYKLVYIWNWIWIIFTSTIVVAVFFMALSLLDRWQSITSSQLLAICVPTFVLFQHIAGVNALKKKKFGWALTALIFIIIVGVVYVYNMIAIHNKYAIDLTKAYNMNEKDTYDATLDFDRLAMQLLGSGIVFQFLINLPSSFFVAKNLKKRSSLQLQLLLEASE